MASIKETIVKENFLLPLFFQKLNQLIESQFINWRFEKDTISCTKDNHMLFGHCIFDSTQKIRVLNSEYKSLFEPVLYSLYEEVKFTDVLRIKLNLYVNHTVQHIHAKHIDITKRDGKTALNSLVTAVLNFTDCDGYTQIEDKKYPSKANSIIIFDGNKMHCGATPTDTKKRVVLNMNVI